MADPIDDGGPAFPTEVRTIAGTKTIGEGMSLRDWFAGQALAGLYANSNEEWPAAAAVLCAYDTADAMLSERKRRGAP